MGEEKLTKKQKKALEFRSKKPKTEDSEEPKKRKRQDEDDDNDKADKDATVHTPELNEDGSVKKKRKTRRGKKGKGQNGSGPRFLIFVGNLPYDVSETELHSHFSAAKPDRIRIRTEKGIAFLEFDNNTDEIQKKMEVALRMHHSSLRNRKINVELTVGGGGNSKNRLEKIQKKNEKLDDERKDKIEKKKKEQKDKKKLNEVDLTNVHPARAKMMQR